MGLWLLLSTHPRKHTPTSPPPPRCCGGSLATTSPTRRSSSADLVCRLRCLAGVDLAFPQLLNFFTPRVLHRVALGHLGQRSGCIALLFVALYAARTGCQWFITYWGHVMGARMEADMRRDLFEQYQRLSFGYYDRHNTGVMMSQDHHRSVRHIGARAPRAGEPVHLHAQDRRLLRAAVHDQRAAHRHHARRHHRHGSAVAFWR